MWKSTPPRGRTKDSRRECSRISRALDVPASGLCSVRPQARARPALERRKPRPKSRLSKDETGNQHPVRYRSGENGTRTHDARLFRPPLYRLSYLTDADTGIRTLTSGLEGRRAKPLTLHPLRSGLTPEANISVLMFRVNLCPLTRPAYRGRCLSRSWDLNPQPLLYESSALPIELERRYAFTEIRTQATGLQRRDACH